MEPAILANTQRQTAIPSSIPVLVVGGGPIGLMASILLGRFGVCNLLVDKYPPTSQFPKTTRLNARTLEILRVLGIEPDVRSQQQQVGDVPLMLGGETLRGPVRFRIDGVAWKEMHRHSPTTWAYIPQDVFEPILRAHAERQQASHVCFGVEVTSVGQDAEGVTVGLLERVSGERLSVRAHYLIAADGARSVHMTCVRTPRGFLPVVSLAAPLFRLVLATHEHADNVTWYVTPLEPDAESHDDVPHDPDSDVDRESSGHRRPARYRQVRDGRGNDQRPPRAFLQKRRRLAQR